MSDFCCDCGNTIDSCTCIVSEDYELWDRSVLNQEARAMVNDINRLKKEFFLQGKMLEKAVQENEQLKAEVGRLMKLLDYSQKALLHLRMDANEIGFEVSPKTVELINVLDELTKKGG